MYEVRHYLTPDGKDVFLDWVRKMRDVMARIAVDRRVNRIELGNFGDHKSIGSKISEIRISHGPGYRLYYTVQGKTVVLLLIGGDKSTQQSDITKAKILLKEIEETND